MRVNRRGLIKSAGSLTLAQLFTTERAYALPDADPAPKAWGYMDRHSVLPGENFDVLLASRPGVGTVRGAVTLTRIGASNASPRPTWTSAPVELSEQTVPPGAASAGANWEPTLYGVDSSALVPGVYVAEFVQEGASAGEHLFHVVVRRPDPAVDVLLKLGTNTYQAYNAFGGHSFYQSDQDPTHGGTLISFDRPHGPVVLEYDAYTIRFLEDLAVQHGLSIGYTTDFDVHLDPRALLRATIAISSSHDEYWSKEMYDAFEKRIHVDGGNTIFYGSDAAYWQVRYVDANRAPAGPDRGRQLVCCKWTHDPIARRVSPGDAQLLITHLYRYENRRPETMLMGAAYQDWFPPYPTDRRYPYRVAKAEGPLFEGTGWSVGDVAADVVGYEWDNRDPNGDGRRLYDPARSRNAMIPYESIEVLFTGRPIGEKGPGLAEAVLYRSGAGAKVFSAGSVRWAWGLGMPGFANAAFRRFNANLVMDFMTKKPLPQTKRAPT